MCRQADLKAFTAFGTYGTSVITALTAQNTKGVQGVHPTPPDFLEQQVRGHLRRPREMGLVDKNMHS